MLDALAWLAESPQRYAALSDGTLLLLALLIVLGAFVPRVDRTLATPHGPLAFLGLVLVSLLASRWPTLFIRATINQDESQAVAQAITALRDPAPWMSFDGNTCGPLNTYVLTVTGLFGRVPTL